ncbi:MAG: BlaI/MecI/CopY family transcriptional regulator [Pirellulales bacterium]
MPRPPSEHPTELELQILKILWEQSPQTARQIRERLEQIGRKLAHTSVITTLQKMVDKRQLKQLDAIEGKALRFSPQIKERDVSQRMLADLVDRVFDGFAEAVMLRLFDVSELDESAVKRMRRALNDKMREKQS